jgi:plastocyanin
MRRARVRGLLLSLLALALPGCATIGGARHGSTPSVVRGRVMATSEAASGAASPRDAVVYLDAAQAIAARRSSAPTSVVVRVGRRFEPRVIAVSVGSKVRFENHDLLYHSVFSVSPIRRFDTGLFGPAHARTIAFEQPGIVELHCGIDDAVGYVLVIPHAVFARADATGAFTLGPLPRGTWTLRAWHPEWGKTSTSVEVGAHTPSATLLRFAGARPGTSALP